MKPCKMDTSAGSKLVSCSSHCLNVNRDGRAYIHASTCTLELVELHPPPIASLGRYLNACLQIILRRVTHPVQANYFRPYNSRKGARCTGPWKGWRATQDFPGRGMKLREDGNLTRAPPPPGENTPKTVTRAFTVQVERTPPELIPRARVCPATRTTTKSTECRRVGPARESLRGDGIHRVKEKQSSQPWSQSSWSLTRRVLS